MLPLKAPVGIHRCSWFLISLVVFPLLLSTGRAADKPNIIIFLVDDMGPMDTSVPFIQIEKVSIERNSIGTGSR